MSLFNRAVLHIKRYYIKSSILLILIFTLCTILFASAVVRNALLGVEENLLLQLPAVSTLHLDERLAMEELGQMGNMLGIIDAPTIEEISTIGNSPYVREYDYIMRNEVYSRELVWAFPTSIDESNAPSDLSEDELNVAVSNMRQWGGYVESFSANGISNPEISDISTGILSLVEGRTFTQEEIDDNAHVVVISQSFADTNALQIGSNIMLENNVYDTVKMLPEGGNFTLFWHLEEFKLANRTLEFEVIGIYDVDREFNYRNQHSSGFGIESALSEEARLHNRIYMPVGIVEEIQMFGVEELLENQEAMISLLGEGQSLVREEPFVEALFVLSDPRDLPAFTEVSNELLPSFWEVRDLRSANPNVFSSMASMFEIIEFTLILSIIGTIIILAILMLLYLYDRRLEIGIYLALGEKKRKIVTLFLIEISLIWFLATIIAIPVGNVLANQVSNILVETTLTEQLARHTALVIPWELAVFNPTEIPIKELFEMFDMSLSTTVILFKTGLSLVTILAATFLPIIYVVSLSPKEILLKS